MGNQCDGCDAKEQSGELGGSQVALLYIRQAWQQLRRQSDLPNILQRQDIV